MLYFYVFVAGEYDRKWDGWYFIFIGTLCYSYKLLAPLGISIGTILFNYFFLEYINWGH